MQRSGGVNKSSVSRAFVKQQPVRDPTCMAAGIRHLHKDHLLQGMIWNCCWRQPPTHLRKVMKMKGTLQAGTMAGCMKLPLLLTS